jgi:hypothetical protein
VRYEWLSQYCREDLEEVQLFTTQWMYDYSHDRQHGLGWHYAKTAVGHGGVTLRLDALNSGEVTAPSMTMASGMPRASVSMLRL